MAFRWPVWIERNGLSEAEGIDEPCPHWCCSGRGFDRPKVARRRRDKDGFGYSRDYFQRRRETKERRTGAGAREQQARMLRQDYSAYLDAHYREAENETNGFMVNAAGRARGITGADFFRTGRRPSVERWGSDELRAWFGSGDVAAVSGRNGPAGVLTLTEFRKSQAEQGYDDTPKPKPRRRKAAA